MTTTPVTDTLAARRRPLAGRVAVVTGAASGIGAATARRLAADGAAVALLARREERLRTLAAELSRDGTTALAVIADVTDSGAVDAAAEAVAGELGRVDLLVANAGVMLAGPIEQARADEWRRMIDTNLRGLIDVTRAFLPALLDAAAEGMAADLVSVSSIGAHTTFPGYAVYSATKAAATAFADGVRADLAARDVRVTTIEPGLTATELGDHVAEPGSRALLEGMFEQIPPLTADDVADLVAYVASRPRHVNLSRVVLVPTRQA